MRPIKEKEGTLQFSRLKIYRNSNFALAATTKLHTKYIQLMECNDF